MKEAIKKARKVFHLKRALSEETIQKYIKSGWLRQGFNSTFLVKENRRINVYTGCCFIVETLK